MTENIPKKVREAIRKLKHPKDPIDNISSMCIYDAVMTAGLSRKKAQHKMDTGDFIAGAMTVLFALGMEKMIPVGWITMMWKSEDIIDEYEIQMNKRKAV